MTLRKQVQRFWTIFLSEKNNLEQALLSQNEEEIAEIKKILGTYFEEMCNCQLEIEEDEGIFELSFLSEQEKNAQIVCALLKKMAPKEVSKNWIIHACMPPLSKKALNTVLRLKGQEYTAAHFTTYYEVDTASRCVNVKLYCDAFSRLDPNKATEIGIYMLQLNIGEVALEGYINAINVIEQEDDALPSCTLQDFYEVLMDVVEENEWTMYVDATTIYRAYHLSENAVEESLRKDMKMIGTMHPLLMNEYLNDEFYIYHQFFDLGGEYGYLYYPIKGNEASDAFHRQKMEKHIQDLLYPLGIARTIGGAIGLKYAYIDVAIFDKLGFVKALEKINSKLEIKLQYRSYEE